MIPFLLLALLQSGGTCGCPHDVPPWQIYEPPLGTTSPGEVGWPAVYLESLTPPTGEWCYVGDHTHGLCSGVFDSPRCFGQWVAVGRLPIDPGSRWVVIDDRGENCHPCYESGCLSRIFSDGFESGDLRFWDVRR